MRGRAGERSPTAAGIANEMKAVEAALARLAQDALHFARTRHSRAEDMQVR
jgi:hypothetical protein